MAQLTVILTFVAMLAGGPGGLGLPSEQAGGTAEAATPWLWGFVAAMGLLAALVVVWGRLAGARLDRRGEHRVIAQQDRARRWVVALALGLHAAASMELGWYGRCLWLSGGWSAPALVLGAAPMLAVLAGTWIGTYTIERRLNDASLLARFDEGRPIYPPLSLAGSVALRLRHEVLIVLVPVVVLATWGDVIDRSIAAAVSSGRGPAWLADESGRLWVQAGGQMAGLVVVALLFPLALERLWRTSPLPGDETGGSLASLADAEGFSARGVRVWHTGGTTVNALMAGVSRWSRRVFLSDALLEALPREQACAVLAHEIGHARRRHVPWLVIWSLGVGVWAGLMTEWGAAAGGLSPEHPAAVWVMLVPVAAVLASFGWVSRRFEWQADAFAVAAMARRAEAEAGAGAGGAREVVVGPEAVHAVAGALLSVARLAGIHPRRPSWRHGTIAERVERVARLEGTPTGQLPIDRQVRGIKWLAAGLVVSGLALAVATGSL